MHLHKLTTHNFSFEAGGNLDQLEIIYHTSPREYKRGDRVVWLCHALTANSDPLDWWPEMVGQGCCVDPDKDFVVCVNIFGSAYGTTGPRHYYTAPHNSHTTATPLDFPKFTVRDTARLFTLVREHLGIKQVDLLVGSSIGGFHALEWAIMEGERIKQAAFIATAPRVSPWISAWMEVQRMALEADPTFLACESLAGGQKGLEVARAISLISYRSFEGYNLTQYETDDDCLFASRAASYERYQGEKLVKRGFDAYSYYYLLHCVDSQNVGRSRGGVPAALAQIKAKTIVIAITSDGLFPPCEGREWAKHIPNAQYFEIESRFGHDGFLLETKQITEILNG
ncbi:MAG: alpha/beta fold hydrolase [Paludibacteraceae bacterium]|nr:alpha/beta fold hydrolase [Paludibacteraceae bacterium]